MAPCQERPAPASTEARTSFSDDLAAGPRALAPNGAPGAATLLGAIGSGMPGARTITARGALLADSGLSDGDVVLVGLDSQVRCGELALVRVQGAPGPMLRRVYPDGPRIRLETGHRNAAPIVLDRSAVRVRGRVIAIARTAAASASP